MSLVTNYDFRPTEGAVIGVRGRYRYDVTLMDTAGKGRRLTADFSVAP